MRRCAGRGAHTAQSLEKTRLRGDAAVRGLGPRPLSLVFILDCLILACGWVGTD